MGKKIMETSAYWLKMAVLAGILVFIIRGFVFIPMKIEGSSMAKTLLQGDQIVYDKFSKIKRFDVIIFQQPDGTIFVKRVIGMPGEHVQYIDDELFVDSQIIEEDFLGQAKIKRSSNQYTTNFDSKQILNNKNISKDAYFVLGDNRRLSKDSRSFGEVKSDDVIGKVQMVYYPLNRINRIK
ncbi:signal peptidase I [Vagococcus salmoninarum]|uniref:signal peptidase I n=1 Tax=Vagococcus salmoninarum TaxID=2739 RepID=UPI0018805584|nr:signal peptidase I [Vagococcus salmoninarum]MBE9387970.1 signal peptidase I [Vagococcus salmoninarum]